MSMREWASAKTKEFNKFIVDKLDEKGRLEISGHLAVSGYDGIRFEVKKSNETPSDIEYLAFFTLGKYPSCCALVQLNNFYLNHHISYESQLKLLDLMMEWAHYNFVKCPQIILNVPEVPVSKSSFPTHFSSDRKGIVDKISYNGIYRWAKSKVHNEMQYINPNTHNIIHTMVVNWQYPAKQTTVVSL